MYIHSYSMYVCMYVFVYIHVHTVLSFSDFDKLSKIIKQFWTRFWHRPRRWYKQRPWFLGGGKGIHNPVWRRVDEGGFWFSSKKVWYFSTLWWAVFMCMYMNNVYAWANFALEEEVCPRSEATLFIFFLYTTFLKGVQLCVSNKIESLKLFRFYD